MLLAVGMLTVIMFSVVKIGLYILYLAISPNGVSSCVMSCDVLVEINVLSVCEIGKWFGRKIGIPTSRDMQAHIMFGVLWQLDANVAL